jgi:hypothetical protein
VERLEREVREAEALRKFLIHGPYPGMGASHPDLFKAFCWRFWNLVAAAGGRIGVVLPRSALCAKGSSAFRMAVFDKASTDISFLVNNCQWVFPEVHPQYTIGLTCITKEAEVGTPARGGDGRQKARAASISLRGPFPSLERFLAGVKRPPVTFPAAEVLGWTDTGALPLVPAEASALVFAQLRKAPRLDLNLPGQWRVRPYQELNATSDKKLMKFVEERPESFWPVYKGESFDIWEPDRGVYYAWAAPEKVISHLQRKRVSSRRNQRSAFFEFADSNWLRNPDTLPCHFARIVFRDVTRASDSRTLRLALIPPQCFAVHVAPALLWPRGNDEDQAFLLGVLSSLPLDWYARRLVETHLTFNLLNSLPVPRLARDNPLWRRTVALAGRLACPDKRFAKWAKAVGVEWGKLDSAEKDDMIAELDAVVAHLYGLSQPQLTHIFETFHEGWDYQSRLKAVLKHFAAWTGKA